MITMRRRTTQDGMLRLQAFLERCLMDPRRRSSVDGQMLLLAALEALGNAAEHGNRWNPDLYLRVDCCLAEGISLVAVQDEGEGHPGGLPDVRGVHGARGRGLGIIAQNTDVAWISHSGRRISFIKGGTPMRVELQYANAAIHLLPGATALVSGLDLGEPFHRMVHGLAETMEAVLTRGCTNVFLDFEKVPLLSSSGWGVLFADIDHPEVQRIVVFNAGPAVRRTWEQMVGEADYKGLRVLEGEDAAMAEMCALAAKAGAADAGDAQGATTEAGHG